MATVFERGPALESVNSRTVAIGPGTHSKQLSVRRERYAENLFEGIGLSAKGRLGRARVMREDMQTLDPEAAASIDAVGMAFRSGKTGAKRTLSKAAAHHNVVVSSNAQAIAKTHARRRIGRRKSNEDDKQTKLEADAAALASELDSVVAQLRGLMAGMDSENLDAMTVNSAKGKDVKRGDDEDEGTSLQARLLRYRYVRKIESPVPPLERSGDCHSLAPRKTDMMDRNLQAPRIFWSCKTQERAHHWNRETSHRAQSARSRRQWADEENTARLEVHLDEKGRRIEQVEAMRALQLERLHAEAASREERLEQARCRQEEEHLEMERRARDGLPARPRSRERVQSARAIKPRAAPQAAPEREERNVDKNRSYQMTEASDEIPYAIPLAASTPEPPVAGRTSTCEGKSADDGLDSFDWFGHRLSAASSAPTSGAAMAATGVAMAAKFNRQASPRA